MNGVTGRMGLNQHLRRSIYATHQTRRPENQRAPKPFMPRPLTSRAAIVAKLEAISNECGGLPNGHYRP